MALRSAWRHCLNIEGIRAERVAGIGAIQAARTSFSGELAGLGSDEEAVRQPARANGTRVRLRLRVLRRAPIAQSIGGQV